tara:strand:- start:1513 stop:1935 length:423 start_codon:yes stop_codon:yes gene_type:complete
MAITFTNVIFDDIIEALATVINDEFAIIVYYDEHKGNQSFLITPESDTLVSYLSGGVQREYNVLVSYELKSGGQYTKNNIKQVSNVMERLKRLIKNNISYENGSKWIDANISTIEYERDEDDPTLLRGIATFNCNNIEVI